MVARLTAWIALGAALAFSGNPLPAVRARMVSNLRRLPNYTCLETVERSITRQSTERRLTPVRFEVAYVEGRELLSWPGESKFEEKRIEDLVGNIGAIGLGAFALHVHELFETGSAVYSEPVPEQREGRAALRWEFRIPAEKSALKIGTLERAAVVAYNGSFWVDAGTLDLLRLEAYADRIPAETGIRANTEWIDYSRVRIGGGEFLLPAASGLTILDAHGNEHRNRARFSGCRQFTGESSLSFADPAAAAATLEPRDVPLPEDLFLETVLEAAIDPARSAIGDVVVARLARRVHKGEIDYPRGARLTGNITRLEVRSLPSARERGRPYQVVCLRFPAIEGGGIRSEFRARLEGIGSARERFFVPFLFDPSGMRTAWRQVEQGLSRPAPGEALFVDVRAGERIPSGLHLQWRTVRPR